MARSARANDGDDATGIILAALRVAGCRAAGNVVAIDLVVGRSFRKSLRLAVGVRGGRTAFFARREAAVDAIAARPTETVRITKISVKGGAELRPVPIPRM